jgi:hypothetical protein
MFEHHASEKSEMPVAHDIADRETRFRMTRRRRSCGPACGE